MIPAASNQKFNAGDFGSGGWWPCLHGRTNTKAASGVNITVSTNNPVSESTAIFFRIRPYTAKLLANESAIRETLRA